MSNEAVSDCRRCSFFRRPVPISGVLLVQVRSTHREVDEALETIAKVDEASRRNEAEEVAHKCAGMVDWPHRPRTVAYCGVRENEGRYLTLSVMNPENRCLHFKAAPPTGRHECSGCLNRHAAQGDERDHRRLSMIARHLESGGTRHAQLEAEYRRREARIGTQKAREIGEAHRNHGELHEVPEYLDSCTAHRPGRVEVPQCVNPHHDCAAFVPSPNPARGSLR